MDLVEYFKNEIEKLKLTDELTIARFIYIKTGELLDYNPTYNTLKKQKQKQQELFYEKMNIFNIKNSYIVCASWARLYEKLLKFFGIAAYYKEDENYYHAYVEFYIGKKKYIADITDDYLDITKIKLGFRTSRFYRDTIINRLIKNKDIKLGEPFLEIDKNIQYYKGIYANEVIDMIKEEIDEKEFDSLEEKISYVFDAIMLIINIKRPYIKFFSGFSLIIFMLLDFLECDYEFIKYTYFYDKARKKFIGVFVNTYSKYYKYYIYNINENGYYQLKKVSINKMKKLSRKYNCYDMNILKLKK